MRSASTSRIVVVGGGMAGLVAACELTRRGREVILLEAGDAVGGRVRTAHLDGHDVDLGAQFLSSAYSVINRLLADHGLSDRVREPSRWAAIVRDGKPRRFRIDRPWSAVRSGLLSWSASGRLLWDAVRTIPSAVKLPLNDYSCWRQYDSESTAESGRRRVGTEALDYVIEPMLGGLYYQTPEQTSNALRAVLNAFGLRRAKLYVLAGGLAGLPRALAARAHVELGSAATRVTAAADGVSVHVASHSVDGSHAILATPAPITAGIYETQDAVERELLATTYSSTVTVTVSAARNWHDRADVKGIYGLLIPRRERDVLSAVALESGKRVAPAAHGEILNAMLSGESGRALMGDSDEAIVARVMPELERYFPGVTAAARSVLITRWPAAEPLSEPGRSRAIARYRADARERRILLAGDYMSMPFTEGASESAVWAVCRLAGE